MGLQLGVEEAIELELSLRTLELIEYVGLMISETSIWQNGLNINANDTLFDNVHLSDL